MALLTIAAWWGLAPVPLALLVGRALRASDRRRSVSEGADALMGPLNVAGVSLS